MEIGETIPIVKHFFSFTSIRNNGAALSTFEKQMTLFYIITVLALSFVFYWLIKDGDLVHNKNIYYFTSTYYIRNNRKFY